jgi:hypothetical protein
VRALITTLRLLLLAVSLDDGLREESRSVDVSRQQLTPGANRFYRHQLANAVAVSRGAQLLPNGVAWPKATAQRDRYGRLDQNLQ